MNRKKNGSHSIFSQRLDQAIFSLYFLGAITPLLALGYVVQRYALPSLDSDSSEQISMLGIVGGIAILSLAAFFALRHLSHNVIAQMDAHNNRLKTMLLASEKLSQAPHTQAVGQVAIKCAAITTGAHAAFLWLRPSKDKELTMVESAGRSAQAIYKALQSNLNELIETASHEHRPASLEHHNPDDPKAKDIHVSALAIPLTDDKEVVGAFAIVRTGHVSAFSPEETDAVSTLASMSSVALNNANLRDAQRNFFAHVTDLLVSAVDAHVEYRNGHSKSVAQYANQISRELGLSEEQLQTLHFASLLHDIGMLKIEPSQHAMPEHYRKHSRIAYRMLSQIRLWEHLAPIILHHHEWYNGSGYPDGIAGDAIPLEARIIAVADAFDAITRNDDRRLAMSLVDAAEEIRGGSGTQFDPQVVEAFLTLAERGEITILR